MRSCHKRLGLNNTQQLFYSLEVRCAKIQGLTLCAPSGRSWWGWGGLGRWGVCGIWGSGGRDQVNQSFCLFQLLEVACVPWLVASPIYTASTGTSSSLFFFDLRIGATLSLTLILLPSSVKSFVVGLSPPRQPLSGW